MTSRLIVNSIRHTGGSVDAVTLASDGTCTANITNKPNRNLIINGAMQVAQRGTSSTTSNDYAVDRFKHNFAGTDEAPTFAQVDVGSSDLPFTKGLTKALKVTNGNQTSGAGTGDRIRVEHMIEAQNIRNSGWNYTSSSSYITLSFYVKSSVAQNFYGRLASNDGTAQSYIFETGSLTANTWTKITKTVPGNSNITINNDNGIGLIFNITMFGGTDQTGTVTLNQWGGFNSSIRSPDFTSTWYTTNDATFEITGVQLEVNSSGVATDFEHRSFGQELALCQRYYYRLNCDQAGQRFGSGFQKTSSAAFVMIPFPTTMRSKPTALETTGTASDYTVARTSTYEVCNVVPVFEVATVINCNIGTNQTGASLSTGQGVMLRANTTNFFLGFSAEL